MARVSRGVTARARHKKVIKRALLITFLCLALAVTPLETLAIVNSYLLYGNI